MIPLLLFILISLLEIYLFIQVGSAIGALNTVLLVMFKTVVGVAIVKQQGLNTTERFKQSAASGETPTFELLEGVLVFFGGALLLIPGFFTDGVGFLCLFPAIRTLIIHQAINHNWFAFTGMDFPTKQSSKQYNKEKDYIDVSFKRRDD